MRLHVYLSAILQLFHRETFTAIRIIHDIVAAEFEKGPEMAYQGRKCGIYSARYRHKKNILVHKFDLDYEIKQQKNDVG